MKKAVVCWSGGKDSCLALYRLLKEDYEVVCLLSMVSEEHARNHAHGIQLEILKMQAEALSLPLMMVDSAGEYESSLKKALFKLKEEKAVEYIAFGSLYVEEDVKWNQQVSIESGLKPLFPVFSSKETARDLLHDFITLGFDSIVCRASADYLDQTWTGRKLDWRFFEEIQQTACCPMGELGEYHTFVINGPIFNAKLEITQSEVVLNSGLWSLDINSCRLVEKDTEAILT